MKPASRGAYQLMHDGALALADAEANGIRIDVPYLDGAIKSTEEEIRGMQEALRQTDIYKTWRKIYGAESNLTSREQLGHVLFGEMRLPYPLEEPKLVRGKKRYVADEEVLMTLKLPFVIDYLKLTKQEKLCGTYLKGISGHVVGELLHPVFSLHLVITYRSSGQAPNFQNIPIRDPEIGKVIRSAFIPRDGHVLVEIDYKGAEVRVAACYHKDPVMLQYIESDYDMHRDMAMECYRLNGKQVTKSIRNIAKGAFVFAEFYGDYYLKVAKNLWNQAQDANLADGTSLIDHLLNNGIKGPGEFKASQRPLPGTFEHHIKEVEEDFWGVRFKVYDQWRKDWYQAYLRHGGIRMKTGFVSQGLFKKNEIINAPIQGSAFHCLLWSMIQINSWLKERKMRSKIVGQIHDSIIIDTDQNELELVLAVADRIMTKDIRDAWPWIVTRMDIDVSCCPVNWWEKEAYERVGGSWKKKSGGL